MMLGKRPGNELTISDALRVKGAIAVKELRDVWRQPRLIVALVLGPFLILLVFGMGYQSVPPPLATVLVVEEGAGLTDAVEELQESLEPSVEIVQVTEDIGEAQRMLMAEEVDIVVATPSKPGFVLIPVQAIDRVDGADATGTQQ